MGSIGAELSRLSPYLVALLTAALTALLFLPLLSLPLLSLPLLPVASFLRSFAPSLLRLFLFLFFFFFLFLLSSLLFSFLPATRRHEREHITASTLLSEEKKTEALATVAANEEGFQSLFDEAAHEALVAAGKRRMSFKAMQVRLVNCWPSLWRLCASSPVLPPSPALASVRPPRSSPRPRSSFTSTRMNRFSTARTR